MQLLKNDTVKQHENHHSGTWGDAEQESGGGVRKQFDLMFLWIFKMSIKAIEIAFFLTLECNYKKNYTVKQHENHHSGTWGDAEQ